MLHYCSKLANKVHMTTGFQDVASQNDTQNVDNVNTLRKPKKFKPRTLSNQNQAPMNAPEGIRSVTFGSTNEASVSLSSGSGRSASTSQTLVDDFPATTAGVLEQVPKKRAQYQPKRKITKVTEEDDCLEG
ncbi:uncharacterized protein MELLADRAFT_89748 [Melampsora larici-populina 98AG31]|uniref:Uncharacterized protein n=1 Tax=Melampsora larici-populina (strain 98AG31 / pathotype 3-4-7) TaxID=747676 RepID=F4RUG9_MELLP|nr:uncharacterized protein MELLADRAFT_89748 [Melampsora larici-populina 98AG31]EGG04000.1 hypothetical protein MELLADRAFT_89748 [Melampsora larici-populina 98AG31]